MAVGRDKYSFSSVQVKGCLETLVKSLETSLGVALWLHEEDQQEATIFTLLSVDQVPGEHGTIPLTVLSWPPAQTPILSEGHWLAHPAPAPQDSTSGPSELGLRGQSEQTCTPLHTTFLRLIVVHWQPSAWLFRSSVTAAGPHMLAHCKCSTTLAQGHEYSCVISPDVGEGHN